MDIEQNNLRKMLSANIKDRRRILGLSQEKLAELMNISDQMVNDIEGCRSWVSDKTIIKLASALRTDVYQLFIPNVKTVKPETAETPPEILRGLQQQIETDLESFKDTLNIRFDKIIGRL